MIFLLYFSLPAFFGAPIPNKQRALKLHSSNPTLQGVACDTLGNLLQVCIYIHTYIYMYTYIYTYMFIYAYMYVYTYEY